MTHNDETRAHVAGTGIAWSGARLPERVTLVGRTVRLEPLDATRHAGEIWAAIAGHDGLWQWLPEGPSASEAAFREVVAAKARDEARRFFAIVPLATERAAGWLSLMRMEPEHGVIEVGNILYGPTLQRSIAATEAQFLLARYVFEALGYRRYEWKCNGANEPSRRAAVRFGFSFEGVFRQHMVVKGANRDTAWFSMLDSEWPIRRAAFERWLEPANFDADGRQQSRLGETA